MKVKKFFFFVKHTKSLTGFIDLGDTDINTLNFEKKEDCQGCFSNLKYSSEAYLQYS